MPPGPGDRCRSGTGPVVAWPTPVLCVPDAIVVVSPGGRVLDLNPTAIDLLGDKNANATRREFASMVAVAERTHEPLPVALPDVDTAARLTFADDLRRWRELNVIVVKGRMIRCTLWGGVAAYQASGVTMDDLVHAVDVSMYESKNAGRNLARVHEPRTTIPRVVTLERRGAKRLQRDDRYSRRADHGGPRRELQAVRWSSHTARRRRPSA